MADTTEKEKSQSSVSLIELTSPKPSFSSKNASGSSSTPITSTTTNPSTTSTTSASTNSQKICSSLTTKRMSLISAESVTAPKEFSPLLSSETIIKKIPIKKKNATEEPMEILINGPSKIPVEKTNKNANEYMPLAIEAPKASSPRIIDETGAEMIAQKSARMAKMIKTATELKTVIPLEPPEVGVLLSAYIPVSFTTRGYIPTDNIEKIRSLKTMKPPSPPLKKTSSSTSMNNFDILEDVSKKAGSLNFLGIDGIGTKGEPQPPPMSPKTFKRRTKACIIDDLSKHQKINVDDLIQKLMTSVSTDGVVTNHLQDMAVIEQICVLAIENLKKLSSMLEISPVIHIVGDLHGQFTDLLRIFERCGPASKTRYLFLGDYVDRGSNSLETICLLLLLKIRYPTNVFMLRGNHECSAINRVYGFYDECEDRFSSPINEAKWGADLDDMKGSQVWYRFQDVFNWLPLTAIIDKRILCMHGGLSPDLQSIEQLKNLKRPIDPEIAGIHVDILWSDPDPNMPNGDNDNDWGPSARGISSHFNVKAVNNACNKLHLDMIVRAHQVVQNGYEFFANRKLVTIFSAPNYCGEYNNSGAIMIVQENLGISFEIIAPSKNCISKKKSKSTEVNFDDIDLDALIAEGSAEKI